MRQNLMPKAVAAILLGSLFGWYIHHDLVTWNLRGRDAFVAYQMCRFDMYMASPRPVVYNVIVTALLARPSPALSRWAHGSTSRSFSCIQSAIIQEIHTWPSQMSAGATQHFL